MSVRCYLCTGPDPQLLLSGVPVCGACIRAHALPVVPGGKPLFDDDFILDEFDRDTKTPVIVQKPAPTTKKVSVKCKNCQGNGYVWAIYIGRAKCQNCDGQGFIEHEEAA